MAGDAGDPLITIKQQLVAVLAPLMPALSDAALELVPVTYFWPGTDHKRAEHVWMNGGRSVVDIPTYKAGRKRRNYETTFEIIVEAQRVGVQLDESNATTLQLEVDQAVEAITRVIDEYLADNPLIGLDAEDLPRVVDKVQLVNIDRAGGPFDTGAMSRNILTVRYGARAL